MQHPRIVEIEKISDLSQEIFALVLHLVRYGQGAGQASEQAKDSSSSALQLAAAAKAGGSHYLYRFCAEQTVTVNTAAAGGNAALLAG